MNTQTIYNNAELAFAAYATLTANSTTSDYISDLQGPTKAVMSLTQSQLFAQRYPGVVAVANDEASGFQAIVFRDSAGNLTLSIRGTVPTDSGDLKADKQISLGGYLATAFTRVFGVQANVTQTSTFNSAGFLAGSESASNDATWQCAA